MTLIYEMNQNNENTVKFSNYKTFWKIAITNYLNTVHCCKRRDQIKNVEEFTRDVIDYICIQNAEIQRCSMITVVFCIMTLESYINEYAIINYSKSYFKNYLDKLDLKTKWIIIPKLVTGNQINTDSEAFELFLKALKIRHRLVHDKTKIINIGEPFEYNWITENEAEMSINAVKKMFIELKKLDQEVDISWLESVEEDPYA